MTKNSRKYRSVFICVVLVLVCLFAYEQLRHNDFVNWDDNEYVTENHNVYTGLTLNNIVWAFGRNRVSYWHPLTWLSHMADCELFGLNAGQHHLTNLLFHIANTLLLFIVLKQMTNKIWQSALAAALFAVHPVNTDSVAWIAERKNVLSTLFWLLTILAYVYYCRRTKLRRYFMVLFVFSILHSFCLTSGRSRDSVSYRRRHTKKLPNPPDSMILGAVPSVYFLKRFPFLLFRRFQFVYLHFPYSIET